MPPLDRQRFTREPAFDAAWERLLALAGGIAMPESARLALARVKAADPAAEAAMIGAVLSNAVPVEALAEHVFAAAVLQVHFTRLAARLEAEALIPVGEGACPACGGPPVASLVFGWSGAHGTAFLCLLALRHAGNRPRVRCVLCGATRALPTRRLPTGRAMSKLKPARVAAAM
jgi:FdhE protein